MKAVIYEEYGMPDNLCLKEIEKPAPKANEVLIKIYAVSINDWDWQLLQGIPLFNRLDNGLFKPKKSKILGSDIAGKIETAGKNVTKFKPGDEVYGDLCLCGFGGFAEYVCVPETALCLKPPAMTFEEAAAIPQAGMLALQALQKGHIRKGMKILINGAGGGVGTLGVQLAKLYQAEVTGVDHAEKLSSMRSAGFDHAIDFQEEDFADNGQTYDLIIDNKFNRPLLKCIKAVCPEGSYVITGGVTRLIMKTFLLGPVLSFITKKQIGVLILKPNKDLEYINQVFEEGNLKPIIEKVYSLSEIPEAMNFFGKEKHKGKIVIKVVQ